jgi:hypothetical protein
MLKHRRFVVPAVPLVLAVIAAPPASAQTIRPNPDEFGLIAGQHATKATPVRPNPDGIGLSADANPTPQARQALVRPNPDEIGSGPRSLSTEQLTSLTRPQVVHVESKPGFDWGDAGIGAGIMFSLAMAGLGAALGIRGRRRGGATAV